MPALITPRHGPRPPRVTTPHQSAIPTHAANPYDRLLYLKPLAASIAPVSPHPLIPHLTSLALNEDLVAVFQSRGSQLFPHGTVIGIYAHAPLARVGSM